MFSKLSIQIKYSFVFLLIPFPDRFYLFRSKTTLFVIPAKAGIQFFSGCLDSRIRGNDENLFRIGITLLLIATGLLIGTYNLKEHQLRNEAMAVAEQVVAFRAWVAGAGVVWVDHLVPEFPDFLSKKVVTGPDASVLEFFAKNPALATRELSALANKTATRVTSGEYRNPANVPDGFEQTTVSTHCHCY